MKILALDSTAQVGSVALCEDEKCLSLLTTDNGNTHSETLLPMVETALSVNGLTADDIDLFAVTAGPGSFTGVRIGVATVKGLAFGKNKNCLGLSTLEALAYNLREFTGTVCPVMNARREQVYTALFSSDGETLTRKTPDAALSLEELAALLKDYPCPVYFVGDGYDLVESHGMVTTPTPLLLRPQNAYSVAMVAAKRAKAGEAGSDRDLKATYLRLPQAERERNERLNAQK